MWVDETGPAAADEISLGLVSLVDAYPPGGEAVAGLRGSPDVRSMTVNADRREPRNDATRVDPERAKAIVDQCRPHERSEVAGVHFDSSKPTGARGHERAPGKEPPHGTEARYNWSFDRCRLADGREAP
jgi:hypothetical protein